MKAIGLAAVAALAWYFLPGHWREAFAGFAIGCLLVSFSEYFIHRMMHWGYIEKQVHIQHHADGASDGWWNEFYVYIKSAWPAVLVGALLCWWISPWASVGWTLGTVLHIAYSALAHELSHTDPYLLFWVSKPIHYIHHKNNQWHHNFAFSTTLWDRIFGTYKDEEWPKKPFPYESVKKIRWF